MCPRSNCRDSSGGIRTRNRTCGGAPSCAAGDAGQESACSYYPCADHIAITLVDQVINYMYNPFDDMHLNDHGDAFRDIEHPELVDYATYPFVIGDELFYLYSAHLSKPGKKYDFKTEQWTELTGLSSTLGGEMMSIETKDGKMWFSGSRAGLGGTVDAGTTFYDPGTNAFEAGPDLPVASIYHALARISPNEIIMISGFPGHVTTFIYNEDSRTFLQRASNAYCYGGSAGMVRADNGDRKVLFAGGQCNGGRNVYVYDVKSNTWTVRVNDIPLGTRYAAEFVINNKLLVLGGYPNLDQVVEITETSVNTLPSLPSTTFAAHAFVKFPKAIPTN